MCGRALPFRQGRPIVREAMPREIGGIAGRVIRCSRKGIALPHIKRQSRNFFLRGKEMQDINSNNGLEIRIINADKIGSATSPLGLSRTAAVIASSTAPRAGDVVVVRALTDSATY